MTFLVILLRPQIRFHNFHALIIYSLKTDDLFCWSFQFIHFSVKMVKILQVHRLFSSQSIAQFQI